MTDIESSRAEMEAALAPMLEAARLLEERELDPNCNRKSPMELAILLDQVAALLGVKPSLVAELSELAAKRPLPEITKRDIIRVAALDKVRKLRKRTPCATNDAICDSEENLQEAARLAKASGDYEATSSTMAKWRTRMRQKLDAYDRANLIDIHTGEPFISNIPNSLADAYPDFSEKGRRGRPKGSKTRKKRI